MNPRITGAFIVGIAFVLGAVVLSRFGIVGTSNSNQVVTTNPTIVAATDPLRQYIPSQDSNNDGVPDWQEMLNDTPPLALNAGAEYQAPETLTDQFALEFFEGYVRNEGFGAFAREPETLIGEASERLAGEVQDTLYFERDITIIPSSPLVLRTHANAVATIIANSALPAGTPNELALVEQAIGTNNPSVLAQLDPIIQNYNAMITSMLAVEVPSQMVKEHLDLVNAFQAVHNDIAAMKLIFEDPLFALMRLQRYEDDARGMLTGMTNFFTQVRALGAPLQPTDPVFSVFSFE